MYNPGDDELENTTTEDSSELNLHEESKVVSEDKKPLSEKIHDALQDWSNKDQADTDFDNTQV